MVNRLKTGTKLMLSFGLIVALLLLVAVVTALRIQSINRGIDTIDERATKVSLATDIDQATNLQARMLLTAIVGGKEAREVREALKVVERTAEEVNAALDALDKTVKRPANRQLLAAINAARAPYGEARNRVVALLKAGNDEEAGSFLLKSLRPAQNDYLAAIDAFSAAQSKLMTEAESEAKAEGALAVRITGVIATLSVAFAVAIGFTITRSLTRQLGGEPAEAQEIASAIAEGNLARSIAVVPGDTASVMARLAAMQQSLQRVVSDVRQNAESVATASAQIAQGNQDLSQRTEEQASALQQTVATMDQLGTTVRSNADSASQANQLAQGAASVALRGGDVVGKVVATMQGITDSSRRIGDIIGVIDGIAFQTNILALNAAVEAARAGEQGRGFAVVASEVRTLAQRSADAAKEIKTLIGRSVEQVEQGTSLVDQAGQTMGEIVASIRRVSDIVAEITSASAEQSSGVQQVGNAVSQMDQVTQQNAALVEESAAAATSLKAQASQLVDTVAVFRLSAQPA